MSDIYTLAELKKMKVYTEGRSSSVPDHFGYTKTCRALRWRVIGRWAELNLDGCDTDYIIPNDDTEA